MANIPNAITAIRLVGVFPVAMLTGRGFYLLALVLFIALALTDGLDGWLARKYGWVTSFGKIFDPTADKVFLLGTLFLLVPPDFVLGFLFICFYEALLFLTAAAAYICPGKHLVLGANRYGKIKAASEIVLIVLFFGVRMGLGVSDNILHIVFIAVMLAAIGSLAGRWGFFRSKEKTARS